MLAMFVVFCLLCHHVGSVFIAASSILLIIFAFPITLCCYKLIAGITYVSALHFVLIFIVLGISADIVLVLWGHWCQSAALQELHGDLNKRMAYTLRCTTKAVLPTASTTVLAFLGNAFSPFMPVCAFAYFSMMMICVIYLLLILYWPALIIVYEQKIKEKE